MNKKKILSYVLTTGVVLGGSNFAYAVEEPVDKAVVETVETEADSPFISDEEAVDIAKGAITYYLNRDGASYTVDQVYTCDNRKNTEVEVNGKKYMVSKTYAGFINNAIARNDISYAENLLEADLNDTAPSCINICFKKLDNEEDKYDDNTVILNAETGEVLRVARGERKEIFNGEVNKEKIKESIIDVLAKAGLKPYENTNWDSMFVSHDGGDAHMYLYTSDKKAVIVAIDLEDFSVVSFYKAYVMYPGESFGIED